MSTWSYTIMGNSKAYTYWAKFGDFIWSFISDDEIRLSKNISVRQLRSVIR